MAALAHLGVTAAVGESAYFVSQRKLHSSHCIRVPADDGTSNLQPRKIAGSGRRVVIALSLKHIGTIDSAGRA
jgi:hypothetical protein